MSMGPSAKWPLHCRGGGLRKAGAGVEEVRGQVGASGGGGEGGGGGGGWSPV